MLSIGEFSRVSRLSIKTLRYYHEIGLLVPEVVDRETGYRYYGWASLERARAVTGLKEMGFALEEVGALLDGKGEEAEVREALERRLGEIDEAIRESRRRQRRIKELLAGLQSSEESPQADEVRIEEIPDLRIFALRHRGPYDEIGSLIGVVYRRAGRHAAGGPFCLYYDEEYSEEEADFEVCMPARSHAGGGPGVEGLEIRLLSGGSGATYIHRGPYNELGRSYARLFGFVRASGRRVRMPIREEYLTGPGLLFRVAPARYRTRLTLMLEPEEG